MQIDGAEGSDADGRDRWIRPLEKFNDLVYCRFRSCCRELNAFEVIGARSDTAYEFGAACFDGAEQLILPS
jgi:hypothetical protein